MKSTTQKSTFSKSKANAALGATNYGNPPTFKKKSKD